MGACVCVCVCVGVYKGVVTGFCFTAGVHVADVCPDGLGIR